MRQLVSKISRPPLQSEFIPSDRYGVGQAGSFNPVGPFVLPDLQGRTGLPLRSVVWQYPRSLIYIIVFGAKLVIY